MQRPIQSFAEIGCIGAISRVLGEAVIEVPIKFEGHLTGHVEIGAFSYMQKGSEICNVRIGRFCSIASNVSIGPGNHPVDFLSSHPFVNDTDDAACGFTSVYDAYNGWIGSKPSRSVIPRTISVGNDVWIGVAAIVLKGVSIGDGAIVAAGSVVTHDVEPYSIVGGVPARHIRYRHPPDVVERLSRVRWWNYDLSPLTRFIDYSDVPGALDMIEAAVACRAISELEPARYRIADGVVLPL